MKKLFSLLIFFIAFSINAQIITNVDKLRIRDVEQGLESDKILVIDNDNIVKWIDAIEVDLSDYYTITEVDAFVSNLEAELLERYTKDEVDALLDGMVLRLDDYYTKTEVDSIITNINDRIDNIDLNTVTSVDNVTSIKIRGSDIFTNNLDTDFAQIADVNKAGFGLISMQSEMKIGLVTKDGTTLLDDVDVSWLASGDLAVTIDDTDPENPELVFSQGGVEVARIPASTLLPGVVRGGSLSGYKLQFKDGGNTVLFDIDLEDLFDNYYTITEADGRFALRTRSITGTGGLTGGGNLTANRTIDLSSTTKTDIGKGVEAHGWGDFRDFGLGSIGISDSEIDNINGNLFFRTGSSSVFGYYGSGISLNRQISDGGRIAQLHIATPPYGSEVSLKSRIKTGDGWSNVVEFWHTGNLENPATETWVKDNALPYTGLITNLDTQRVSGYGHYNIDAVGSPSPNASNQQYLNLFSDEDHGITFAGRVGDGGQFFLRSVSGGTVGSWLRIADRDWVNNQSFVKDLSNYYTKNESNSRFVRTTGVQNIADTKTFLASPVVPNPTLDSHAVNRGWVEEVTKLNHARYQTDSQSLATSGFIEFNGTPDFTSSYITQLSNKYEFQVEEDGFYEITLSWRSAFGQVYFLDFEINGSSKIINSFNGGGQVFQYTYREYLNEGDLFRIRSDNEIQSVKCTLYIKKIE